MATAGSIIVDLLMRTGSFETDTARATKNAQRQLRALKAEAKDAGDGIRRALTGTFAGLSVGAVFWKFVQETRDAQNEVAQLGAVLRSTGNAAGYSMAQLNAMSAELANSSVFSEGEIARAQTRLLSYTGIMGEQFPRAMQAVIDMSARLGMTVEQSAETVGRALDVPSQGLTALSKQGFRFTEEQEKLVGALEKAGRTAEAQGIILSALESSYGGAAAAARNTFGGALTALQNQINSLMTGEDGSLNGAVGSINELTATLSSNETKEAFALFTSYLASAVQGLVNLSNAAASGSFLGWLMVSGDDARNAGARINDLEDSLRKLREERDKLDPSRSLTNKINDILFGDVGDLDKQIAATESKLRALRSIYRQAGGLVPNDPGAFAGMDVITPSSPRRPPPPPLPSSSKTDPLAEAKRYLDNLQKQIEKTKELSVAEQALVDIREGRIKGLTPAYQQMILERAKEVDVVQQLSDQEKRLAEFEASLRADRLDDVRQREAANESIEAGNRQLEQEIELIGLSEEAQRAVLRARESSTIALKEEQLARLQNEAYMSREAIALEEEIRLLRERQELNDRKSTAIIREQDIEKAKDFTKGLETDLKSAFQAAFNDSENPAQAFVKSLASVLYNRVSSALATALFDALAGSGGGGGGLLGSLLQTGLSFLGSGGSSGLSFGSSSLSLGGSSLGLKLPGRAAGGPVAAGQAYIVGERRPELFIPHTSGQILPSVPALGSVRVVVNNNAPAEVKVRGMSDGEILLQIDERIAGQVPGIMASQARSPSTQFSRQLSRSWNVESKRGG